VSNENEEEELLSETEEVIGKIVETEEEKK